MATKEKIEKPRKPATRAAVQENGEGVPVVQLATRVPRDLYKSLKLHAVKADLSIGALIAEAITDLLAKKKVKAAA